MPATKKKPTKKPATRKTTPKKHVTKRTVSARATKAKSSEFMQARFTEQTIYWLIIGVAVITLAAWVLSLQVQLNDMYDQIEASDAPLVLQKHNR